MCDPDGDTDVIKQWTDQKENTEENTAAPAIVREGLEREIARAVLRCKLAKRRHLVLSKAILSDYLDALFPGLLKLFQPQTVYYNGGVAAIKEWKISCYLEVMDGGVPTTHPNLALRDLFLPLLQTCNDLFLHWYRQQHACNHDHRCTRPATATTIGNSTSSVRRLMTFVTRYTPAPDEQALLKHVDGAGKVDGSVVVALPIDRWSGPDNAFEGGGLTFWDKSEIHYDTRSGDVAFIDRAVWHQADPITKGTRWALVIFYKVVE